MTLSDGLDLLRAARARASDACETLWLQSFQLARTRSSEAPRVWASPGGQRVLIVAPHPDDEAVGCAGTILRHQLCGDQVRIMYITDGRRSRAWGLAPQAMAAQRQQEAEAAATALGGVDFEWFGLAEGEWSEQQLHSRLHDGIITYAPHCIYAPSRVDFHPEHHKVAGALASVLLNLTPPAPDLDIRVYQLQVPLSAILVNLVADTSDVAEQCAAVLQTYVSQTSILSSLRLRRYAARRYGFQHQAEEFWHMTPQQYVQLHQRTPALTDSTPVTVPTDTFRGIRFFALSDPLAYVRGRRERKRLADRVRQI